MKEETTKKIKEQIERIELHIGVVYLGVAKSSFAAKEQYNIADLGGKYRVQKKDAKEFIDIPGNQVKAAHGIYA